MLPRTLAAQRRQAWPNAKLYLVLACLGITLGLSLPAAPLLASGGGITVIDSHYEIDFPDAIRLSLTVQGNADISNVRLFYRTAGSETWSRAYPNFSPGQQVTANLTLATGKAKYLPPGAELEYYYSIRDAAGNVHQTPSAVIEYLDNRIQWDRTQIGHLLLLHHDLPRIKVSSQSRDIKVALNRISGLLPAGIEERIKGVIYNGDSEALDALPSREQTMIESPGFGGFAFPDNQVFVGFGFEATIIVHEAAHLLLDQAVGPKGRPLPAWLDEGFANYAMPPHWDRHLSKEVPPLTAMSRVSGTPEEIYTFYQKAESVVAFLIEEYGIGSFQTLVRRLAQGNSIEDALMQVYGFGVSGLDTAWALAASARADWALDERQPSPLAPGATKGGPRFAGLWVVIIAALVIIVLMYIVDEKIRSRR